MVVVSSGKSQKSHNVRPSDKEGPELGAVFFPAHLSVRWCLVAVVTVFLIPSHQVTAGTQETVLRWRSSGVSTVHMDSGCLLPLCLPVPEGDPIPGTVVTADMGPSLEDLRSNPDSMVTASLPEWPPGSAWCFSGPGAAAGCWPLVTAWVPCLAAKQVPG